MLVAIFFFYSGYGITKKQKDDDNYVRTRLQRRMLYLIELIVGSEIIYYFIHVVAFGRKIELFDSIMCITGITMLNGALWTVTAMLIIQACIWIFERTQFLFNCKYRYTVISVIGVIVYIVITLLRGRRGAWEMQSCFAFALGAFLAEDENRMRMITKKQLSFFVLAFVFVIAFIAPYLSEFMIKNDLMIIRVVFGTLASCTFILLMIAIFEKVKIGNMATRYIGTLFTEIYVSHGIVLNILKFYLPNLFRGANNLVASIISIAVVLVVASGLKGIEKGIKQRR